MNTSVKRIQAILVKDYKEFSRNIAVSSMIFLPLILAAMYARMGVDTIQGYFMSINITFSMVATYVQCCLIAEEKEKNTLRSLMLSPASTSEILIGKSTLTFISTMLIVGGCMYFSGYMPGNLVVMALALMLSAVFYIAVGTFLGLFAKSVMESSVIVLPVLAIFSLGPMGMAFIENYPILKVVEWLPSVQIILLGELLEKSYALGDLIKPFAVIIGWIIVAAIATVVTFKKRMVD
ncbi:ABC transporter permease [Viridibacillus sp. FSL R5-0477]|uniref:ABC-2 type transport system permease n=1 Tax=Viridibacillus arenosi FSL R5-213 TaxID=1227360 RepID=W4ER11_9BACL|nr:MULTISPECIES: ABC transporter permease [Viridibacillus]ETT82709.1 ABC-2 type transport system permease [Viridibacillus arenosi FSL R5-213]OMC82317.1 ABC transporter [Viridibacillus sp. FSL H7-0596]OMC85665.1 ABC transporter [Viridibacillus sp. FSL H8-0123]OMC92220.1 ABC transporter [Viridibacillus arenosi]